MPKKVTKKTATKKKAATKPKAVKPVSKAKKVVEKVKAVVKPKDPSKPIVEFKAEPEPIPKAPVVPDLTCIRCGSPKIKVFQMDKGEIKSVQCLVCRKVF